MLYFPQSGKCRQRGIAGSFERVPYACEFLGPIGQPRTDGLQRLIRRAGGFHDRIKIRWIEMARDEAECFQRLQQGPQHGHDVVHHGLAHRALLRFL